MADKTPKMLEVEKRIRTNLETYLTREYQRYQKSANSISERLDVDNMTLRAWLKYFRIPIRGLSESKKLGSKKPARKWLKRQYVDLRRTTYDIADRLDVSGTTIGGWLRDYKIPIRKGSEAYHKGKKKPTKSWMQREYVENKRSTNDIAEEVEVDKGTIASWLENYGIKVRTGTEAHTKIIKPTKKWFTTQYVRKKKSTVKIAEEIGVSSGTVVHWLEDYGIKLRTGGEAHTKTKKPTKYWLNRQYSILNRNTSDIAEEVGVSSPTLNRWRREYEIPLKSKKPSREWLEEQYVDRNRSAMAIARGLGVNNSTVGLWLKAYQIERPSKKEQLEELLKGFVR